MVRPEGSDEYDLDAVCLRTISKEQTTQQQLKNEVGAVLARYVQSRFGEPTAPTDMEERKRCWTLFYRVAFHLDVLPSIPNPEGGPTGILLTDRKERNWQYSDPIAYGHWFKTRMAQELLAKRVALSEAERTPPAEIPAYCLKTTLQQVVQILKIHRNRYFAEDLESRPPSVLISTLAAHVYQGERDLRDAVIDTAQRMPDHIEYDGHDWVVPNPVEPRENFADKWTDRPELATAFYGWLEALQDDLNAAQETRGLDRVVARLAESFGEKPVQKAAGRARVTGTSASGRPGVSDSPPRPVSCPRPGRSQSNAMTSSGTKAMALKNQAQQLLALENLPLSRSTKLKRGALRWEGELQPTPLSERYLVEITASEGKRPTVLVLAPALRAPEDHRLPHTFAGERLCLCYPWQWNRGLAIARTIVPWTSEWLLHYEIWLATGHWHGGGHPESLAA